MEKNNNMKKHYFILLGLIILTLAICLAFYNIYNIIQNKKISNSPLSNATSVVLYEDLYNTTKDLDADTFLVISYSDDEKVYNNEKQIKKFLNKHNLLDNVVYLDITDKKNDENLLEDLNTTLQLGEDKINQLPAIVFYKDGVPMCVRDSKDHLMSNQDFQNIMDMYQIAS